MTARSIDVERLRAVFAYDPDTGVFTRRLALAARSRVGEIVGSRHQHGYIVMRMDRVSYNAHRMAYAYVYGDIPVGYDIDHINGDRADNRLCNLRLATRSQNLQNQRGPHKDSTTGVRGVTPYGQRYVAQIMVDGKNKHLGVCDTVAQAAALRTDAERRLHPFSPMNA